MYNKDKDKEKFIILQKDCILKQKTEEKNLCVKKQFVRQKIVIFICPEEKCPPSGRNIPWIIFLLLMKTI